LAFFLSTQATVTGLAEYAELRAGLRLGDDDGFIRSVPRTYRASLIPGRDVFENRHQQQRGAFQLASLESGGAPGEDALDDVTGSLPAAIEAPGTRPVEERRYPVVNRANKGDRQVMRDGTRRVQRVDTRTGRLVRVTLPAPSTRELALRAGTEPPATPPAPAAAAQAAQAAKTAPDVPVPPNVTALASTGKAAAEAPASKPVALTEKRNRELMCLAKAVYFEARGESETGQIAVAQVVLNRVATPFYPDNICDVVFQNQERRNKCQFSFACDGRSDRPRNEAAWAKAITLAKKSMRGTRVEEVGKSTHYHANYVRPRWIGDMVKQKQIGKHIFYRVRSWS
jgi:spore germination cell wall hydrolase CwlJ-like protein